MSHDNQSELGLSIITIALEGFLNESLTAASRANPTLKGEAEPAPKAR